MISKEYYVKPLIHIYLIYFFCIAFVFLQILALFYCCKVEFIQSCVGFIPCQIACTLVIRYHVFRWELCKGSVWESVKKAQEVCT